MQSQPTRATDFTEFRDTLHRKNLSRSAINNYSFAINKYHEMWGEQIEYPFLKRNDEITYYLNEEGILELVHSLIHENTDDASAQTFSSSPP